MTTPSIGKKSRWLICGMIALGLSNVAWAARKPAQSGYPFKKVMIVVLENQNSKRARKQKFLASLAKQGTYLSEFYATTHPSQPNYIAMTSGATHGVKSNGNYTRAVRHIGDLLEARGLTWKNYAEGYPQDPPGGCFLGGSRKQYSRKHVPFLTYQNIQNDPARCARSVVAAEQLDKDVASGTIPTFSIYTPDNDNNGHDTGIDFAGQWLEKRFGPLLSNPKFMQDMLFVVTFDEDNGGEKNRVYTLFLGPGVKATEAGHEVSTRYTHYSLLRTIEDAFGLGTLGLGDQAAQPIEGVWSDR